MGKGMGKNSYPCMGMGNAVPYPYPFYPLGKAFSQLIYPWVKKLAIHLP
jgi:hypothetical protein